MPASDHPPAGQGSDSAPATARVGNRAQQACCGGSIKGFTGALARRSEKIHVRANKKWLSKKKGAWTGHGNLKVQDGVCGLLLDSRSRNTQSLRGAGYLPCSLALILVALPALPAGTLSPYCCGCLLALTNKKLLLIQSTAAGRSGMVPSTTSAFRCSTRWRCSELWMGSVPAVSRENLLCGQGIGYHQSTPGENTLALTKISLVQLNVL